MENFWVYENHDYAQKEIPWEADQSLEHNGFSYLYTLGHSTSSFHVAIWVDTSRPIRYLVDVNMNEGDNELIMTNLPGLISLLREISPVVELNMKVEAREDEERRVEFERGKVTIK